MEAEAVSGLEVLLEMWQDMDSAKKDKWIKRGIAVATIAILAYLESLPNDPEDIPNREKIDEAKDRVKELESKIKSAPLSSQMYISDKTREMQIEAALERLENYRHELFAPGKVKELDLAMDQVLALRKSGEEAAAAMVLYQAWQLARITEEQVLQGEKEWEEANLEYLKKHSSLQTMLDIAPDMTVEFTENGVKDTAQMDADFWSEGWISQIKENLPEAELSKELTIEQVGQHTKLVEAAAEQVSKALAEGKDAFGRSRKRMTLCSAVYETFEGMGWCLDETKENGFEKADPRKDALLHLYSPTMDRLEFTFSGEEQITLRTKFANVMNQGLMRHLEQVMRQELEKYGYYHVQLTTT